MTKETLPKKQKLAEISGRFKALLPWASLCWGIISGVLVSRGYEQASKVFFYVAGLIVFSLLMSLWAERYREKNFSSVLINKIGNFLKNHNDWVEWFGFTSAQVCVQYVLLYCLPLLYFAGARFTLFATLLVGASTLWDPWWMHLAKYGVYLRLVRMWGVLLGVSFLFAVFASSFLELFYPSIAVLALLTTWPRAGAFGTHLREIASNAVPPLVGLICAVWQFVAPVDKRFPLLSVWLKDGGIGFDVSERKILSPISDDIAAAALQSELKSGRLLCCSSPIVAPGEVKRMVIHEWWVNGAIVDRVELPEIHGSSDGNSAFRTHSCKANFDWAQTIASISCLVYIDPGIYIGARRIKVTQ